MKALFNIGISQGTLAAACNSSKVKNSLLGSSGLTPSTWAARRREIQFRFVGERGELVGDDLGVRLHADAREELRFAEGMSRGSSHSEWYAPLFRAFAQRVRTQDRSHDALDEALYVTRLTARAYESSREGRTLPFAEAPGLGWPGATGAPGAASPTQDVS